MRRLLLIIMSLLLASLACNLSDEGSQAGQKRVTEERPALVLLAPANQNTYLVGTTVTFHAVARDIVDGVARIEFRIDVPGDPVTLIENTADPQQGTPQLEATLTWVAVGNQSYLVEAQAFRPDGTPSNVEQISIRVVNPNPPAAPTDDPTSSDSTSSSDTSAASDNADAVQFDLPTTNLSGTITTSGDPVRQGPGTNYLIVTTLNAGDTVPIAGRSEDNLWYVVQVGNGFGFVLQATVQVDGDTSALPVVGAPPQ